MRATLAVVASLPAGRSSLPISALISEDFPALIEAAMSINFVLLFITLRFQLCCLFNRTKMLDFVLYQVQDL